MTHAIKLLYGVPFPGSITKEFLDILERYGVYDLDTGSTYVRLHSFPGENNVDNV